MQTKKENYWFMFRLLLLLNVVLIAGILLARPGQKTAVKHDECCSGTKKVSADVLNAITIKLM